MNSLRLLTYEFIKDNIVLEMADFETFVIAEGNRARQHFSLYGVVFCVIMGCV